MQERIRRLVALFWWRGSVMGWQCNRPRHEHKIVFSSSIPPSSALDTKFVLNDTRIKKNGIDSGWSSIVMSGIGMQNKSNRGSLDTDRRRRSTKEQVAEEGNDKPDAGYAQGLKQNQRFHTASACVRVVLNDPYAWTLPALEGFDVLPRSAVSFAVRHRRVRRLGWPYSESMSIRMQTTYIMF